MAVDLTHSDWYAFFRPHALHLAKLYSGAQHYPPWVFVLLWPLAALPVAWGYVALSSLSLIAIIRYVRAWWRVGLLVATAPIMLVLGFGNMDVLLSLAFVLPLSLALVVVACKPQALAFWAVRKLLWHRPPLAVFVPLFCVILGSFVGWGWWPGRLSSGLLAHNFYVSQLWPWTVVPGLLLLATRSPTLWLVGSAMLSPYLQLYHLTPLLIYVYRRGRLSTLIAITILSWVVALRMVGG